MNESQTRLDLIDPALKAAGWGVVVNSKLLVERDCQITDGRKLSGGRRGKPLIADYILEYKGIELAVVEAKRRDLDVSEGVAQAKLYASKLACDTAYSTNGDKIYRICLQTGKEEEVTRFETPQELWEKSFPQKASTQSKVLWRDSFLSVPFEDKSGT